MGIDGIGKKPPIGTDGLGGVGTAGGVGATEKTGATFEVGAAQSTTATSGVDPTSPLARLRAGEIDVNQYVDLKVDEATRHLGAMPATDLADIRSLLREKLVSDPGFADLVQQSTGHGPPSPVPEE